MVTLRAKIDELRKANDAEYQVGRGVEGEAAGKTGPGVVSAWWSAYPLLVEDSAGWVGERRGGGCTEGFAVPRARASEFKQQRSWSVDS